MLSPVARCSTPPSPNCTEPAEWQQTLRCVPTSRMTFSDCLVDERLAVRVGLDGEAGQPVGVVRGGQRCVVDVDPAVVGEVGVDGDAEATVLQAAPHPEAGVVHDDLDAAVGGVVHRDVAGAGDEEDPPVRGDRQLHDLAEAGALAEDDLLELRQVRRVVGGSAPSCRRWRPCPPGRSSRPGRSWRRRLVLRLVLRVTGRGPVRHGIRARRLPPGRSAQGEPQGGHQGEQRDEELTRPHRHDVPSTTEFEVASPAGRRCDWHHARRDFCVRSSKR